MRRNLAGSLNLFEPRKPRRCADAATVLADVVRGLKRRQPRCGDGHGAPAANGDAEIDGALELLSWCHLSIEIDRLVSQPRVREISCERQRVGSKAKLEFRLVRTPCGAYSRAVTHA